MCQISQAIVLASGVGRRYDDVVGQALGQVVDMLIQAGEGVAEQFAGRLDIGVATLPPRSDGNHIP